MENDDARDVLLNVLDRCAANDGPFWEATPEQRAEVSSLLGSPSTTLKITTTAEGEPLITGAADMFLAVAILAEIAIDLAETAHGGRSREEAVFAIRERLSVLLP